MTSLRANTTKPTPNTPRPDEFVTIHLGDHRKSVRVPVMPSIFSPAHDKAKCFDYFTAQLLPLRHSIPPAELIAAYAAHCPVNTIPAENESRSIADAVYNDFFNVTNLNGRGFYSNRGVEINFKEKHLSQRPANLHYFRFNSTVTPATIDPLLMHEMPIVVEFDLPLPQTISPSPIADSSEAVIQTTDDGSATSTVSPACLFTPETAATRTTIPAAFSKTPKLFQSVQHHTAQNAVGATYHGPVDFLDNQATFSDLWPRPHPVTINPKHAGGLQDTSHQLRDYADQCQLTAFTAIYRLHYVGTDAKLDYQAIEDIASKLRRLTMVYKVNGETKTATPDAIFNRYLDVLPMLPEDATKWGFNIVSLFWTALTDSMRGAILNDGYRQSDYSDQTTKTKQLHHLNDLRQRATKAHTNRQRQEADMLQSLATLMNHKTSGLAKAFMFSLNDTPTDVPHPTAAPPAQTLFQSQAEKTLSREYTKTDRPWHPDEHPVCPDTGYVSVYPFKFRGCFGCGSNEHEFRQCQQRDDRTTKDRFHREFKLHMSFKRKRPAAAFLQHQAPQGPAPESDPFDEHTHRQPAAAASPPIRSPDRKKVTFAEPTTTTVATIPRILMQIVHVLRTETLQTHPIPIAMSNSLPTITLRFGQDNTDAIDVRCLFDSCAAISSGYKPFHLYIMSAYPNAVHSYEQFDDAHPFTPVKLAGAVKDPDNMAKDICGNLDAVIRYHTPYKFTDGQPCILSFALSDHVTVNTIVGWHTIRAAGMNLNVITSTVHSACLNTAFNIQQEEPRLGLPPAIQLPQSSASMQLDITPLSDDSHMHIVAATTATPSPLPTNARPHSS